MKKRHTKYTLKTNHTSVAKTTQRWSAICQSVCPWTLTYQKFLLCISSQGQDLYSHTKN